MALAKNSKWVRGFGTTWPGFVMPVSVLATVIGEQAVYTKGKEVDDALKEIHGHLFGLAVVHLEKHQAGGSVDSEVAIPLTLA